MAFRLQIVKFMFPKLVRFAIAIMCAVVFCLSFLFSSKAQATSAEEITLRYNSNDIHTFIEFNNNFSYISNTNCVGVYMPNGQERFILHLGFSNLSNQVIKISPKHYLTIILTVNVTDAVDVADFFSIPHAANGVVLVDFQSYKGNVYNPYDQSRHYKLTYYNGLNYDADAFLGNSNRSIMHVTAKPHNPQMWVEKQWGVDICAQSVYVYRKLNTSQEQNDFYKNENNAQNNIKNQDKNGDNNNNPTQKSQTLLQLSKDAFDAITKIKPTNCQLVFDFGVVKLPEQNMCSLKVPSYIQIISSILIITVTIPATIAIFNRIMSLIKEMQH
jgi:hypothetical protein